MNAPPMYEGAIDGERLDELVDDWSTCARILEVHCKRGATQMAEAPVGLEEAVAALRARRCRAVQVRYEWEGATWCDTVLAAPRGLRLVRVRDLDVPPPGGGWVRGPGVR